MSERRRLRAGRNPDEAAVPARLRRFRLADWIEAGEPEAGLSARLRFNQARRSWARAHGYDLSARYGTAPGRDWWAFLALCKNQELTTAKAVTELTAEGSAGREESR